MPNKKKGVVGTNIVELWRDLCSNEFVPSLPHNTVYRMIPSLENYEC